MVQTLDEPGTVGEKELQKGLSRRDFLKIGAAAGALVALESCTKAPAPTTIVTTTVTQTSPPPSTTAAPTVADVYTFFNASEAAIVKAVFGQIIPGTAQDPGAVEAAAHIYIDRALGGFYHAQQTMYRRGLAAIDTYSQSKFKRNFVDLTSADQITVLSDMQSGAATGFYAPDSKSFLGTLIQHCREGMFCDPPPLAAWHRPDAPFFLPNAPVATG